MRNQKGSCEVHVACRWMWLGIALLFMSSACFAEQPSAIESLVESGNLDGMR